MRFYFSGIKGAKEYPMLEAAGVECLLVDQFKIKHIPTGRAHVALDSGAYDIYKRNLKRKNKLSLDLESYLNIARSHGPFDFAVAPDVIGDPEQTRQYWERLRGLRSTDDPPFIPVFQWGASRDDLSRYLDESPIVGIGGLVMLMRARDAQMLEQLEELCTTYPQRFHLFGCNWIQSIDRLHTLLASGDSSKWLDGARYRQIIFVNTKTRRLSFAPCWALKLAPDPEKLCIQSAQNIEAFTRNAIILNEEPKLNVQIFDTPLADGWRRLLCQDCTLTINFQTRQYSLKLNNKLSN